MTLMKQVNLYMAFGLKQQMAYVIMKDLRSLNIGKRLMGSCIISNQTVVERRVLLMLEVKRLAVIEDGTYLAMMVFVKAYYPTAFMNKMENIIIEKVAMVQKNILLK